MSSPICKILAIVLLDDNGKRIYSKYFTKYPSSRVCEFLDEDGQKEIFESSLLKKSKMLTFGKGNKNNSDRIDEIFSLGNFNIVFKSFENAHFFVVGEYDENEVFLQAVLETIFGCFRGFLTNKGNQKVIIDKFTFIDNFQHLIIIIDEVIDQGIVVTLDQEDIMNRTTLKPAVTKKVETESKFSSVFASARSHLSKTLNLA